jgi:hypothetical protein
MPPLNTDERITLESWLDFHRATLAMKCEGLDDQQAATASVPPSAFTLTGLVQHMAEVERNWFRRVLAGEQAPPIYDPRADPRGPDGGFDLASGATLPDALATWQAEIARAREHCAARSLADNCQYHNAPRDHPHRKNGRMAPFIAVDRGSAVDPVQSATPNPPPSPDQPPKSTRESGNTANRIKGTSGDWNRLTADPAT